MRIFQTSKVIVTVGLLFVAPSIGLPAFESVHAQQQSPKNPKRALSSPSAIDPPEPAYQSYLSAKLVLPNRALEDALNSFDVFYAEVGKVEPCTTRLVCKNFNNEFLVRRAASVKVASDAGTITVVVPLGIEGYISVRGPPLATMHRKVTATLDAVFKLRPTIEADWCIDPRLEVSTVWRQPPKFDTPGLSFVEDTVGYIKDRIDESAKAAFSQKNVLPLKEAFCKYSKARIRALWRSHSIQVNVLNSRLYLNVHPVSVRYSGPKVNSDGTELLLGLRSNVRILAEDIPSTPLELPPLQPDRNAGSKLRLDLPIAIPNDAVKESLSQYLSHNATSLELPLGITATQGASNISIDDGQIALSLGFSLGARWSPFNLAGQLDLSGEPAANSARSGIALSNTNVALRLQNPVWNFLLGPWIRTAEDSIRKSVVAVASLDAAPFINKARDQLQAQTERVQAAYGLRFKFHDLNAHLERVSVDRNKLTIHTIATSTMTAELDEVPLDLIAGRTPFRKTYKVVNVSHIFLREKPDVESRITGDLVSGPGGLVVRECVFANDDQEYKWCKVESERGTGYLRHFYLEPEER